MKQPGFQTEQISPEWLAQVGQRLQELRMAQDLSLEDVETKTLIPRAKLRALEAGNLAQLPEPVYIQGFIRLYAELLGIDVREFDDIPLEPIAIERRSRKSRWPLTVDLQIRPIHLYVFYILLVLLSVNVLANVLNRSSPPSPLAPVDPAPVSGAGAGQDGTTPGDTQTATADASPAAPTATKPVRLSVSLTEQSWLRVEVDGSIAMEGVLPEGTERSWEAEKQITLRAGNAGGVLLSFNDAKPVPMGEPGTVQERTFRAGDTPNPAPTNAPTTEP